MLLIAIARAVTPVVHLSLPTFSMGVVLELSSVNRLIAIVAVLFELFSRRPGHLRFEVTRRIDVR